MENALRMNETQGIERTRDDSAIRAPQKRVVEMRPSIDVLENGEGIRILADVPGVDASHADVHVELPHLRIACAREGADGLTIRYAATLTLPSTIDGDSLSAQLKNGVLEIAMNKSAQARARRIEVRHGRADG
jgi:HSP20 family protein